MFARILQLIRSVLGRLWRSFKALINGIWKIITFPFRLFFKLIRGIWNLITFPIWLLTNKLPQLFANEDTREFALDIVKTIISAASLIATVIAAIGLFFSYQDARLDRQLTQERLITERFTKALEQIGKKDQEEVVIGGIYSLERIAKDSPKDQWTIMEVLTAFVRKNSPISAEIKELDDKSEEKIKALENLEPVNIQVQAALTVIGRRNPDQDNTQEDKVTKILDLSEINLNHANLESANLEFANLESANLESANLESANLLGAQNLSNRQIKSACFWEEVMYLDVIHIVTHGAWKDKQADPNQWRIDEIKLDKDSDPTNPPDCSKWKR